MRRKKLANKIVSILMAGLMLVSTPMSALATDGEIQQMTDQIEVQTSMDNEEITENDDSLTEEMTGEDAEEEIIADEEVTADESVAFDGESEEEIILGDSEEEATTQSAEEVQPDAVAVQSGEEIKKQAEMAVEDLTFGSTTKKKYDWLMKFKPDQYEYNVGIDDALGRIKAFLSFSQNIEEDSNLSYTFYLDEKTIDNALGVINSGETITIDLSNKIIFKDISETKNLTLKVGEKDSDGNYTDNSVTYTFHLYQKPSLSVSGISLTTEDGVACNLDPVFSPTTRKAQYNIKISNNVEKLKLSLSAAYENGTEILVNGKKCDNGKTEIVLEELESDEAGYLHIPIQLNYIEKIEDNYDRSSFYDLVIVYNERYPEIIEQPKEVSCKQGDKVSVAVKAELQTGAEGKLSYQWYRSQSISGAGVIIEGAESAEYIVPTDAGISNWYYCVVSNNISGKKYSVTSDAVKVDVETTSASAPTFSQESGDEERIQYSPVPLYFDIAVTAGDNGSSLTAQWYVNTTESTEGATSVGDPISIFHNPNEQDYKYFKLDNLPVNVAGEFYYYCVVTATFEDTSATAQSRYFKATIQPLTDEEYVKRVLEQLTLPEIAYENIELPVVAENDVTISWTSSDPEVISEQGVVTRTSTDRKVVLTAKICHGEVQKTQNYSVLVPADADANLDAVTKDLEAILLNPEYDSDITLPAEGENGSHFTWSTSDETVVTAEGKVTRPEMGREDAKVTLTVEAVKEDASASRAFEITILAVPDTSTNEGKIKDATYKVRKYFYNHRVLTQYWSVYAAYAALGDYIQDPANGYVYDTTGNSAGQPGAHILAVIAMGENPYNYKGENLVQKMIDSGNVEGSYAVPIFNSLALEAAGSDYENVPLDRATGWLGTVNGGSDMGGWAAALASRHLDNEKIAGRLETFKGLIKDDMGAGTAGSRSLSIGCVVTGFSALTAEGYTGYDVTKDSPWVEQDPVGILYTTFEQEKSEFDKQVMMEMADLYQVLYQKKNIGWLECGVSAEKLNQLIAEADSMLTKGNYSEEAAAELRTALQAAKEIPAEQKNARIATYGKTYYDLFDAVRNMNSSERDDQTDIVIGQKTEQMIQALPEKADLVLADQGTVNQAYNAYEKLTAEQKKFVSAAAVEKLTACREEIQKLIQDYPNKISVSYELLGDSLHGENGQVHTLKEGTLTAWINKASYQMPDIFTVKDVMEEILIEHHMTWNNSSGNYVSEITDANGVTLGEFSNGADSGWMYKLNGKYPNLGVKEQKLKSGDEITFHYTDNYMLEHIHTWAAEWTSDETAHWHACEGWCPNTDVALNDGYAAHTWSSVKVVKAATCEQNGSVQYECTVCGYKKNEAVFATGHKYGAWTTVSEATVSAPTVQTRTCTVCENKETRKSGSALQPTIKVNAATVPLKVKQKTSAFKVTGLANGDSIQSYKSSNTKIFTVTKSGVLKAGKKTGKATLTITLASGLQKKVTVKVQKKTVTTSKITGLQKKVTLKKGAKLTLAPSRTPITSTQKFTYKSSNKKIATVSSKGVITGKKAGKTKITVKSGKKKYTVTVTVTK